MSEVISDTKDLTTSSETHSDYDVSALTSNSFSNAPPTLLIRFVLGLRRFFLKLADLVVPPEAAVFERVVGVGYTTTLGSLARLGVPDLLASGPLTAAELAKLTQCNEDALHRALRGAVTLGIFSLSEEGKFSNNRLSQVLKSGDISRAKEFAEYFSSKSNCHAYCEFDHILKTGDDGFMQANGMDLWEWFDNHTPERDTFAQMMMGVTISEAPMVAKLYPFNDIKKLCDVGGGSGALLSEILIRYPHLQGVLLDCDGVIDSAKQLFSARAISERIEFVSGNFFDRVIPGCDAYLLKNVMHDWNDELCIKILNNCRDVMSVGQKVLLVEILLEKNDTTNFASLRDIHVMTVCTGGRERSREDYAVLLQNARFKLNRVFYSPIMSVIEGVAI